MVARITAALALLLMPGTAAASLVLDRTRVVIADTDRDTVLRVHNDGEAPALVTSWLGRSAHESVPEHEDVPFVLLPPLVRVDGGQQQALRILSTGQPLPADRESLFWLHVLEIPQRPAQDDGTLQLAVQTTLKVFARPPGLAMAVDTAARGLRWQLAREPDAARCALVIDNPAPLHVTLTGVQLHAEEASHGLAEAAALVAPLGRTRAALQQCPPAGTPTGALTYTFLDDQGDAHTGAASLVSVDATGASPAAALSSLPTEPRSP